MRRATAAVGLLTLVGGLGGLGVVASAGPTLSAVVSYDDAVTSVPGVRVVSAFPSVRAALVRGDRAALARLARSAGVRGVSPDSAVFMTGSGRVDRDGGVYAAAGLGGRAGKQGAGQGIRVAVVDTGVSDTAALTRASGRLVDAADSSSVGDEGGAVRTQGEFVDGYGHGTFMASVVAGGRVGKHYLGVAPAATVLVVRVARPDGTSSLSKVLGGLDWIAAHPAQVDVANLSFSHDRPMDGYGADPLTDAVERVRDAGVTIVVASGNKADRVGDPGFTPRVLTVGAADLTADRVLVADFSGSGVVAGVRKPDVVASGVGVLGMLPTDSLVVRESGRPARADGLWKGSGTSQATAIASGLAALLLERHPGATPAQVKASLRSVATDLPGARDGVGLVAVAKHLVSGPDGQPLDGSGGDPTGEGSFDASSWGASSWGSTTWAASSWARASSWAASSWAASTWAGRFDPAGGPDREADR